MSKHILISFMICCDGGHEFIYVTVDDTSIEYTRKYPLRGCFLGPLGWPEGIFFRGGQTDADGASGAINGMKR